MASSCCNSSGRNAETIWKVDSKDAAIARVSSIGATFFGIWAPYESTVAAMPTASALPMWSAIWPAISRGRFRTVFSSTVPSSMGNPNCIFMK